MLILLVVNIKLFGLKVNEKKRKGEDMKYLILIIVLVLGLSGCVNPPVAVPKTRKQPVEQKMAEEKKEAQPPKKIILRRVIIEETLEIVNWEDEHFLQVIDGKEVTNGWEH